MRACHAKGPGSIPSRDVSWMMVFRGFSSPVRQEVLGQQDSRMLFGHLNHAFIFPM